MRNYVLLSVLLLSACASAPPVGGAAGAVPGHRNGDAGRQPAARKLPVAVESPQPARRDQGTQPPRKREHNVEED